MGVSDWLEFCPGLGGFRQHHAGLFTGAVGVLFELDERIPRLVDLKFPAGFTSVDVDAKGFLNCGTVDTAMEPEFDTLGVN